MITVGIDAHKDSYTLVAIDEVGKHVAVLMPCPQGWA